MTQGRAITIGAYPEDGNIVGEVSSSRAWEENSGAFTPPSVVTLGVIPQEAVTITRAIITQVDIDIIIHWVAGVLGAQTSGVTPQYIFETYNVMAPPRLGYSLEPALRISPLVDDPASVKD